MMAALRCYMNSSAPDEKPSAYHQFTTGTTLSTVCIRRAKREAFLITLKPLATPFAILKKGLHKREKHS
jgi:hypothetical protein